MRYGHRLFVAPFFILVYQALFRHEPKKSADFLDFLTASFFKSGVICRAARQIFFTLV